MSNPSQETADAMRERLDAMPKAEREAALMDIYNGKGDPTATGTNAPEAPDGWGPLRLAERPTAEPFPLDVLPPALEAFCREVSDSTRAPVDFVGGAMLAVAGAAIGQSVNVRLKRDWTEPPLLYLAIVGDPGTTKTPALRGVGRPLARIDKRLRVESREAREAWEKKAKASKGGDDEPGPEPPQLRAVVKDITRESLCIVLKDNPRGVLCAPDELTAWVGSFDQYRSKGTDTQFWLSMWGADAVSVDRKGGRESLYVPHPFAAVLGGIQPDMLAELRSDRDNGFLDRLVFMYPDVLPSQRWTDSVVSEEAERDWSDVVNRLCEVPMEPDGDAERPWHADLAPEAKRRFTVWYTAQGEAMDDPERSDGRRGAMSKARAITARLALILSRMRLAGDPTRPMWGDSQGVPPIEAIDVEGAIRLAAYLENHRERAVGRMTRGTGDGPADAIVEWLRAGSRETFTERELTQARRRLKDDPDALAAAMARLAKANAIRPREAAQAGPKGGRPSSAVYDVNPALLVTQNPQNPRNP